MKTAIYIDDGITQLVLTPQNEWEKNALAIIGSGEKKLSIHRGSFYACHGGWVRQGRSDDNSLIFRVDDVTTVQRPVDGYGVCLP